MRRYRLVIPRISSGTCSAFKSAEEKITPKITTRIEKYSPKMEVVAISFFKWS